MQREFHLGNIAIELDFRLRAIAHSMALALLPALFLGLLLNADLADPEPARAMAPTSTLPPATSTPEPTSSTATPTAPLTPITLPPLFHIGQETDKSDLLAFTPPDRWTEMEQEAVQKMVLRVGQALADEINQDPEMREMTGWVNAERAFWLVFGGAVEVHRPGLSCNESRQLRGLEQLPCDEAIWGETIGGREILVFDEASPTLILAYPKWIVHELGHAFSNVLDKVPERAVPDAQLSRSVFAGPLNAWQFSLASTQGEVFADLYLGWVFDTWGADESGAEFMETNITGWIRSAILINGVDGDG